MVRGVAVIVWPGHCSTPSARALVKGWDMSASDFPAGRGSTLVEVMIASAVLAVSIMATLSAMATFRLATGAVKEEALAVQLASGQMNSLRSMSFQEVHAMAGDTTFELCPASGEGGRDNTYAYDYLKGADGVLPTGSRHVTIDNGTLVVEVEVTWSSAALGRVMSRSLFWRAAP